MAVSIHLKLVLVVTIGVLASVSAAPPQKADSQSTSYRTSSSSSSSTSLLTAPAVLTPTSSENVRFSRLLKDNAEVLRFTSLSNVAPELARAISKESKEKISNTIPENTVKFGRRVLDYDDTDVDESSQKIITRPEPGNEYVYIQPPGIATARDASGSSDFEGDATLTGINKKPANHRIPVALLRQTNGNRVNINPVFPNVNYDEQPTGDIQTSFNQVPTEIRSRANSKVAALPQETANLEATTSAPHYYNEEYEATTPAAVSVSEPEEIPTTTVAQRQKRKKMVVNVVTSHPRVVFDNTTNAPLTTTTTTEAPVTTPSSTTTTTTEASTSSSVPADEKENLLVQASTRNAKSFPDFEDSPTRLQTAESSQPARVNVRPASSGKDYEYEYIYYYYDDDDEDNSTKKAAAAAAAGETTTTRLTTTLPTTTTTAAATTTTTTPPPDEASYEDELEDEHVEEKPIVQKAASPLKNSFSSAPVVPAKNQQYISEKVTASNPSNLLEKTRGQKTFPSAVADSSEYKLEHELSKEEDDEYDEQHDEPKREILSSSLRGQGQAREVVSDAPIDTTTITAARPSTSGIYDSMPKLAKTHASSINTPIVLKMSNLQRVPASQLLGAIDETPAVTTTTTTTTTTAEPEVSSRANKYRAQTTRLRGNTASAPGNTVSRAIPSAPAENAAVEHTDAPVSVRQRLSPSYKDSTRRVASRRPHIGEAAQSAPEAPQASPSITVHSEEGAPRSVSNIRTRFPPRTTVAASPAIVEPSPTDPAPEVSYQSAEVSSISPVVDANSVSDKKVKENFVRNKSANELYAFTRLQQAIHSRTPSRSKELINYNNKVTAPKVGGFLNSQEQTTDAPDSSASSEATTVSSYVSGYSGESSSAVTEQPSTSTTTTTTTEAVQLDRFGKPKRFPGRTRRPSLGSATTTTTTTEASTKSSGAAANRFNGRRRKFGTSTSSTPAEASENIQSQSASPTVSAEAPSRTPGRSRFANRNRGSTTTEASADAQQTQHKEENGEQSTAAPQASRSRRPNHFQSRKRLNKATTQTPESEDEAAPSPTASSAPAATPAAAAAPAGERRTRPSYGNHGRSRPALTGGPGPRIRSQRLGGSTTTTTEAPASADHSAEGAVDNHETAEQSPNNQGEQTDVAAAAPVQTTTAAPEPPKRGSAGVLGRLRNRSKPISTTTPAPEPVQSERKPPRSGGLLSRRKTANAATTTTAAPAKEVKEDAEEEHNHAQEQVESQHKGVVVQISSTVSEGEEVQEGIEEAEPSSTTQGSILNRLKSQRKPGSIYRKRPEPHGE